MIHGRDTTSAAFFDAIYEKSDDPWNFSNSAGEQARYGAILQSLPVGHFRRAFEPGCSIGALTERLADRCHEVEAIDISARAVALAKNNCKCFRNVHIQQAALPSYQPRGTFDLIVFSEIGYYFQATQLASLCDRLVGILEKGGILLAAHWQGSSPDHILDSESVHQIIGQTTGLRPILFERHASFLLQRWDRTSGEARDYQQR